MGWIGTFKQPGQSVLDFFKNKWERSIEDERGSLEIIDSCVFLTEAFFAVRIQDNENYKEPFTFAAIVQIRHFQDPSENFLYKDCDECCGPRQINCPDRILDQLSPTNHDTAKWWREECKAENKRKASRPKLEPGITIVTDEPLHFGELGKADTFKVLEGGRNPRFMAHFGPMQYRVRIRRPSLNKINWKLKGKQPEPESSPKQLSLLNQLGGGI